MRSCNGGVDTFHPALRVLNADPAHRSGKVRVTYDAVGGREDCLAAWDAALAALGRASDELGDE